MHYLESDLMPRKTKEEVAKEKRREEDLATITKDDFFKLDPVLDDNPDVVMLVGQRSNGKTYGVMERCIKDYKHKGYRFVYVRRYDKTITPKNIADLLAPFIENKYVKPLIKELWGDTWSVKYYRGKFIVFNEDEESEDEPEVIGYTEALNTAATTKGKYSDAHNVHNFVLDEFLRLKSERPISEELNAFEQLTSTVFRTNTDCRIYLIGNTVSVYSEYFTYFGVNTRTMTEKGKVYIIDLPNEDGEPTRVAYEWCLANPKLAKKTSKFMRSSKVAKGDFEIDPVAEIPHNNNERAQEKMLCTLYDSRMGTNLGIFKRRAVWYTYEVDDSGITRSMPHKREFLVVRQTDKQSSYYHLSNVKSLDYGTWTDVNAMFKDIKERCCIDIKNEWLHNRFFSENMFVADYFYNTYVYYLDLSVRDFL